MLSENTIDNLVQPIVNRQEAINTYVISKIARTVREIGELSPNDIKRMQPPQHFATLLTSDGRCVMNQCYRHEAEVTPEPTPEPVEEETTPTE